MEGGGGWVVKISGHMPITRQCIGCGAVLQLMCSWWCGVARMVGGSGVAEAATPIGVAQDLAPEENAQHLVLQMQ